MKKIIVTMILSGSLSGTYATASSKHESGGTKSSGSARDRCTIPSNGELADSGTMAACVKASRILLDTPPDISSPDDILRGNLKEAEDISLSGDVSCEFVPMTSEKWETTGNSEKFICYHIDSGTSSTGKYFSSKGTLVPPAVSVGAYATPVEGLLLDADGRVIPNAKGKPYKAELLKVKYYLGNQRMREPFTETAATRLFWALGIPVDHVFFPKRVTCQGCLPNPYQARQAAFAPGAQTFLWASIEKNFDGSLIRNKPEEGWKWETLRKTARKNGQTPQFETLFLAARLIAMSRPKPLQNKTRCADVNKQTGECDLAYSYVADLGSSFGQPNLKEKKGPRKQMADLKSYRKQNVFKNKQTCTLDKTYLKHNISEAGRSLMAQRLLSAFGGASSPGSIDPLRVRAIFQAAHFEGIDMIPADSGELAAWTDKMTALMTEVLTARCSE